MIKAHTTPFARQLHLTVAMLVAVVLGFALYVSFEKDIDRANLQRYQSYLLADELRQSSDDLTRMARSHVVTLDPQYKQYYQQILDIRNGLRPRPQEYHNIYWDLVLQGNRPPGSTDGPAVPLIARMREAGFTVEELAQLALAKANSDGLTNTEFEAFRLVELSEGDTASARERARQIMHNAQYHRDKQSIMQPIAEFNRMIDRRTSQAVRQARARADDARLVLMALGALLLLALLQTHRSLQKILGASVDQVAARITRIGQGDFSGSTQIAPELQDSVMGRLAQTQLQLQQIETERQRQAQSLRDARDQAEAATRTKSQFLANMSHEIRTPMNAVLGLLKLMQGTALQRQQLDYVQKSEAAARSLMGIINDILDFSKIDAGRMTIDRHPLALEALLRDLAVVLAANVGSKPIEVLYDIDARLPTTVLGDAQRLQQVLTNLCGNAIKFTEQGQVLLSVQVLEPGTAHGEPALIEFAVKDTGIGIAPEHQSRIFDGFSQAEASTTRRFGGTGLGLAISKNLVALMGGTLALHSEVGAGSCFSFSLRLPEAPGPMLANAPKPNARTDSAVAHSALIVDDSAVAAELHAQMLGRHGWQCDVALGGQPALLQIQQRQSAGLPPYDVIYLDWRMPGLDGWDTLQRIRQLQDNAWRQCSVVMVTGNDRDCLNLRSPLEQGLLNGFLVKPVTASMLIEAASPVVASQHVAAAPVAQPTTSLRGLRLLVVEDNLINQQVAEELLSAQGASVALAANGQLGVQAVQAADPPFDAVLMDLQMPVLDGLSATRAIRALGYTDLPIIAMTANAMASDRDDCLAAGMNEHVGKPFDILHLCALLLRLTGHPG